MTFDLEYTVLVYSLICEHLSLLMNATVSTLQNPIDVYFI